LEYPEIFSTKAQALRRIEKMFGTTGQLPDIEDDCILLWEVIPGQNDSRQVVWSFLGWHWMGKKWPRSETSNDILPRSGRSLYQLCREVYGS